MLGPIFIAEQVETLQQNLGQKLVFGTIFIAGQVETLQQNLGQKPVLDRNLCSVQFSLPDKWKPYNKLRKETCAQSDFHFRTNGNLTIKLRAEAFSRLN